MSSPVFTSEELRVVAMSTSSRRGKSVARRRLLWRWFAWVMWSILLPLIGALTVCVALAGLVFWQYMGHDQAYFAAQKWVQQEFGKFQTTHNSVNSNININGNVNYPAPSRSDNTSLIPLTDEATPDLQIDRNLTFKAKP